MKRLKQKLWKPYIILPMLTLFFLAGFIGSYIFPNTVLDTFVINMEEEEDDTEVLLPLSLQEPIVYELNTKGLPMRGIQVGINKRGYAQENTTLVYAVYKEEECISRNVYGVAAGDDIQYVYLPFENYEACIGDIKITFLLETAGDAETYPALMANHAQIEHGKTTAENRPVGEEETQVALKCSHIYTHDTYPFLYDCRLLTFVFLAASMAVVYPQRSRKEEKHAE